MTVEKFARFDYVYKIGYKLHGDGMLQFVVCFDRSDIKIPFDNLRKISAEIKKKFDKMNVSILGSRNNWDILLNDKIIIFKR